jgi:IPT/TIG domain
MGRSQRHSVYIRGTDASGKGLSEKQPAIVYIQQYAASQALAVPLGPPSGPLKGSSLAGFPPTLIPAPGLDEQRDAELTAAGEFTDPGQFNFSGNPIYEDLPATGGEPPEPIDPPVEPGTPVITSIDPAHAEVGAADLTMTVTGTGFTAASVILFNNGEEATTFVSETSLTTGVKPSLASGPAVVPVQVREGELVSAPVDFTFTEAVVPEGTRAFPLGPFTINRVEDHADGIAITLADGDVQVGDAVLVEATGNTSINGAYTVLSVSGLVIVVDNDVTLETPIEAKGRLTVNGEA